MKNEDRLASVALRQLIHPIRDWLVVVSIIAVTVLTITTLTIGASGIAGTNAQAADDAAEVGEMCISS